MPRILPFLDTYDIIGDIGNSSAWKYQECRRKSDGKVFLVKVICKFGLTELDLKRVNHELLFWRRAHNPNLLKMLGIYDESSFIYIIYEHGACDLASVVFDNTMIFTEGFARHAIIKILKTIAFLHANGICHGAVLPLNIVFMTPVTTPGWVHSAKLCFVHVDPKRTVNLYTDLQDISFTLCFILRRTESLIYREDFHPRQLYQKGWEHLTDECLDFVKQMWFSKEQSRSIEYLLNHPWIVSNESFSLADQDISSADLNKVLAPESNTNKTAAVLSITSQLLYKNQLRDGLGRRRWRSLTGHLLVNVFIFSSPLEDDKSSSFSSKHKSNDPIPLPIYLHGKSLVISAVAKHDYMFAIMDTTRERLLCWLRFPSSALYQRFKTAIMEITDPAKQKPGVWVNGRIVYFRVSHHAESLLRVLCPDTVPLNSRPLCP